MKNSFVGNDAELTVLKLVKNISVTRFSDSVFFAEADGNFVKLDFFEQRLLSEFDGKNTLADITASRLEQGDTSIFDKLITLIEKLNENDLLDPECAEGLKKSAPRKAFYEKNFAQKEQKPSPLLALAGKILTSVPSLAVMAAIALVSFLVPSLKGVNIFTSITQGAMSPGSAYLFALFFILVFLFVILSLPAVCSAADLAAHGISPRITLRNKCGFFYLSASSAQIIGKGRSAAIRHYAMMLMLPFVVSGLTALLWHFGIARPAMAVMNVISTACGIIALSPISSSPLSMIIDFFMPGSGKSFTYARKHFIKDIFGLSKLSKETERMMIVASIGLVWIYFVYSYFWSVARSTMSYLFSDIYSAYTNGAVSSVVLIALTVLLMITPAVAALAGFITIALGNIGSVVATPLVRMRDLAGTITAKAVPATSEIIEFLKEIPLFAELKDEDLTELCSHIKLRRFMKNSPIVRQGDKGDNFYTIVSGKAKIVVSGNNGAEKTLGTLSTGDSFGETALIEKGTRTASIITLTQTAVFEISREGFEKFLASNSENREKITGKIRLGKMLLASSVFSFMSQKQISYLIKNLKPERIKAGTVVFKQGDEGNKFYLIQEGNIHLERFDNSLKTLDIILKPGNFFGEMALVKNIPRTATAEAVTDSLLFTLDKESFCTVIGSTLSGGKELDSLINERAKQLGEEVVRSCSRN
ncbi:cyclic nucleotide-binding domain-containing protein [bacterium]|nr:cyclic nucleotide-binding domain-containing protein [bacterium]MBP5591373.1 cyclic nucleotide-binding domain-containing protein [bacterium]